MPTPNSSPVTILLIEDNPADVFLIREALSAHGLHFDLATVEDGDEAIDFLERTDRCEDAPCPGMLILDLNLPKRTGEEVLSRLRESPKCGNIPVIVLTSSIARQDKDRAKALRVDDYFVKPNDLESFLLLGGIAKKLLEGHVGAD